MSVRDRRTQTAALVAVVAIVCVATAGIGIAAATTQRLLHSDEVQTSKTGTATPRDPSESGDPSGTPVQYSKESVGQGRGLTGYDAAERVLSGLGGQTLVQDATAQSGENGSTITVRLSSNDGDVPQVWIADVTTGAIAELMRNEEATASVAVASAVATGPDHTGEHESTDLGLGAVRLGQVFDSPSDSVLIDHVRDVAKQFGLTVSGVQVLHPLESALAVTLVVPDDATTNWTIDQLRSAIVGDTPDVEGLLLELDDSQGQALLRSGVAYRTGEGGLWFAPGQDDSFGAVYGGPPPMR